MSESESIEVTEEMIKAGRLALFPHEPLAWQDEGELVIKIYRAMEKARNQPLSQDSLRYTTKYGAIRHDNFATSSLTIRISEAAFIPPVFTLSDLGSCTGVWTGTHTENAVTKSDFLAALAEYGQAREWQPIETAPKGCNVLLLTKGMRIHIDDWGDFCIHNHPHYILWQPLPPLPKGEI